MACQIFIVVHRYSLGSRCNRLPINFATVASRGNDLHVVGTVYAQSCRVTRICQFHQHVHSQSSVKVCGRWIICSVSVLGRDGNILLSIYSGIRCYSDPGKFRRSCALSSCACRKLIRFRSANAYSCIYVSLSVRGCELVCVSVAISEVCCRSCASTKRKRYII